MLFRSVFRGILIGFTTLAVFTSFYRSSGDLTVARTGALATLVLTQLIHVFECKREEEGIFKINLLDNWKLVAAVLFSAFILVLSVNLPICNLLFQTTPLTLAQMGQIAAYCAAVPVLSSMLISYQHRRKKEKQQEEIRFPFPLGEK